MSSKVNPYKNSTLSKKTRLQKCLIPSQKEYDGLNRVISFGIDIKWRKKVVALVKENTPQRVLDIATGTGDLAIQLSETGAKEIIGLDISKGMLEVGREKVAAKHLNNIVSMVVGDSEALPFETSSFDAITVAFGVRNFENLEGLC